MPLTTIVLVSGVMASLCIGPAALLARLLDAQFFAQLPRVLNRWRYPRLHGVRVRTGRYAGPAEARSGLRLARRRCRPEAHIAPARTRRRCAGR